ncbi:hypothetical protein FHX15_005286 [Rhizobium sp. BK650]|nr:hypothetical protein [Rhizobium sp. BK650]
MALSIADHRPSIYLDLESDADRAKLAEPELYLSQHSDKLFTLRALGGIPKLNATMIIIAPSTISKIVMSIT